MVEAIVRVDLPWMPLKSSQSSQFALFIKDNS
jgi:hypothetical protein